MKHVKTLLALVLVLCLALCLVGCKKNTYTVTFDTSGGSVVSLQTIEEGKLAQKPSENPTKEGHTFAGWYSDQAKTVEFDWQKPIKEATTVYAKWTLDTIYRTVTFDSKSGSTV